MFIALEQTTRLRVVGAPCVPHLNSLIEVTNDRNGAPTARELVVGARAINMALLRSEEQART
jgi:hypothetical protein